MPEDESQQLTRNPEWSIIQDGNGYNFMSCGGVQKRSLNGDEVIEYNIKVDNVVKRVYNLNQGKELNDQNIMKLTVNKLDLIHLNLYDDANRKILYTKSLKHEPTELSRREENLRTFIDSLKHRILVLEAENIRLHEKVMLFRSNPALAVSEGAELFEKSSKAIADLIRPKDRSME